MIFLQDSELEYHGNLKSSNCVVNSRWTLQLTDFGLLEVRAATYKIEDEHAFHRSNTTTTTTPTTTTITTTTNNNNNNNYTTNEKKKK